MIRQYLCNKAPNPNVTDKKLNWVSDGKFTTLGVHFSTTLEEMVSINYDKVMISVKNTIQHWSKRNLTVLGRLTIVKTLMITFNWFYLSQTHLASF